MQGETSLATGNPRTRSKSNLTQWLLVGGLLSTLLASQLTHAAEHKDPAPLSDEVIRQVHKALKIGGKNPFVTKVDRSYDRTTDLVDRFTKQRAAGNATHLTETRALMRAQAVELNGLRDEYLARNPQAKTVTTPVAVGTAGAEKIITLNASSQFTERFDRLSNALERLATADDKAIDAALADMRKILSDLRSRNHPDLDKDIGLVPTWTQGQPTKIKPEDLPRAPEPRYVAANQRAPGNNVYAFLGNTLLAALPDPVPAEASTCNYNTADLGENIEIQLTPEIKALAEKLEYSPAKIYAYVNKEIAYEPYFGSLKGAMGTLVAKAGGPTDQASLMIALLRASKIPARYVRGEALFANDDRGLQWIGAKTNIAAHAILTRGQIAAGYEGSGVGKKLWFDHVWVEACVPYGNYRGTKVDKSGHRWIPLDPSFKEKTYQAGITLDAPFDYTAFYDSYLAFRKNGPDSLPHEAYAKKVEELIKVQTNENNTIEDVPYRGTQVNRTIDILPASLPYQVRNFFAWGGGNNSAEAAEVPDAHRYKMEISGANLPGTVKLDMPKVALSRVTLSFEAATEADKLTVDTFMFYSSFGSIPGFIPDYMTITPPINGICYCPCNVTISVAPANVRAVVKVDGALDKAGSYFGFWRANSHNYDCSTLGILMFDTFQPVALTLTMKVTLGSAILNQSSFSNTINPSEVYALFADAFTSSDHLITERAARLLKNVNTIPDPNTNIDETVGEYLHLVGLKYLRYVRDAAKRVGSINGGSGQMGNSIGMVSTVAKAQYLYDLPYAVSNAGAFKGLVVDFPGGLSNDVDITTGVTDFKSFVLSGYAMSALESYVWQENARMDAVSSVRGIQFAREKGIEILRIDASNRFTEILKLNTNTDSSLNYSDTQINQIKTYLDWGYTLTLPRSLIYYDNWKGAVWVQESAAAGVAGYIISGGYAGGYATDYMDSWYTPPPPPVFTLPPGVSMTDWGLASEGWSLSGNSGNVTGSPFSTIYDLIPATVDSNIGFGLGKGNTYSNDPVNMVTGNMYHTERDIALKGRGGLPIVFERSYNSRDAKAGPLGAGWTHSFNQYLSFEDDNQNFKQDTGDTDSTTSSVTWVDGTGALKFIQVPGDGTGIPINSTFTAPKGYYFTTVRNADGYTITEKSGLSYQFESMAGTLGQKARLIKITDRNGNSLRLSYTPIQNCDGTYVCTVTDDLGRSLTFSYDGDKRIQEIKDWDNRRFQYTYDSFNNLTSFKNPLAASGVQNAVSYEYYTSDARLKNYMKRYTLPRGNGMTFEYYSNGKTFKHYTDAGETATFTYNEFRRESIVTNERGHTRRFFFDANGNLIQLVEENGAKRDFVYDPNDHTRRKSKRDPEGYLTEYEYDAYGNVSKIINPSRHTVEISEFNEFNQPGKVKDARGNYTLLKYDGKGNLTHEIVLKNGLGAAHIPATYTPIPSELVAWVIHTYDDKGNRTSTQRMRDFVNKIGPIFTYKYGNNQLNVVEYRRQGDKDGDGGPDGVEISPTLVYDNLGRPTTDLTGNWYEVEKYYDSVDRITRMTDALGNLRDYKYDANGNPIEQSLVMPYGNNNALIDHSSARYDSSDRKTASLDVAGNVTAYQYDAVGNVVKVTNPDNYSLTFDYNEANQVVKAYDQEGHAVTKTLDLTGKPRSITDPNGNTVTYEYYGSAKDGRLKQTIDPAGRKTEFDYDANGNTTMVKLIPSDGSADRVTLTEYDELNRPIRSVGPLVTGDLALGPYRAVTKNTFDNLGNLQSVAAGRTDTTGTNSGADSVATQVTYTWDDFGRKIKETDPLTKEWKFEYDTHNNLIKSTDAKGQETRFAYSNRGLLLSRTDHTGKKTTYTYNALGQVLTAQSPEVTYSHSYDKAHRLASVTDSRGGKKISYAYSPGGLLNKMSDNESRRTDYLYDSVGRLTGIWAPNDDYVAYVYDPAGRLTEKWFPNGVNAQYTWNKDSTLAKVSNRINYGDSFVVSQHDYTYNGVGQREKALDKLGVYAPPPMTDTYGYDQLGNRVRSTGAANLFYETDAANQLLVVRSGSNVGPITQAYVYDANGNMTQKCEGGTVTRTQTTCTGNNITRLTYNALDQLAQVDKDGTLSQYAYDDAGRRIQKTVNGNTTNYLYNGPDIQAEYQTWSKANVSYTHGPNTDDPTIRVNAANDANYFHQDGLGSVVATTDASSSLTAARLYDAWGNPHATARFNSLGQYGYTGREPDAETGLMYYRARYYDPSIGRFTQRDPAGMPDGVNRYAYVAGDPVNATDPEGEVLNFLIGAGSSVILGGIIRGVTGGDIFDAKAIAMDAALGAVGVGIVNKIGAVAQAARAGSGIQKSKYLGNVGESAAGIVQAEKESIRVAGRLRIPDAISNTTITEVKNVAKISARDARQIADDVAIGADRGLQTVVKTRPGADVSRIQGLIDDGSVIHKTLSNLNSSGFRILSGFESAGLGAGVGMTFESASSYVSDMFGGGGAGVQTMSGVSPRP